MSILVNNKEIEYKEGLCALDLVDTKTKGIISCKIKDCCTTGPWNNPSCGNNGKKTYH